MATLAHLPPAHLQTLTNVYQWLQTRDNMVLRNMQVEAADTAIQQFTFYAHPTYAALLPEIDAEWPVHLDPTRQWYVTAWRRAAADGGLRLTIMWRSPVVARLDTPPHQTLEEFWSLELPMAQTFHPAIVPGVAAIHPMTAVR